MKNDEMVVDWDECAAVSRAHDVMSGAVVFKHTRVPVAALFENLDAGLSIEEFMEQFEPVSREQVREVLEFAARSLCAA